MRTMSMWTSGTRISLGVLLLLCLAACSGGSGSTTPPAPPPDASSLELFDSLWDDFDRNYSFFVLKDIDWNDSKMRFRSQLTTTSTETELFTVLSDMLLELEDPHVRLDTPHGNSRYTGWFDRFPTNFNESIVTATYLGPNAMTSPQTGMLFGRIDEDIGYVRVHSLGGSAHGNDTDYVLGQLQGVRGMVVDLRSNGGGNDQNGAAIAARFADTRRLYRRVRFRDGPNHDDFGPFIDGFIEAGGTASFDGPISVLTNRGTISSAESLVLAFAVFPNAVSFGDFTGGGSANPEQRQWTNGWRYTVSRWIEYRPDGTTFEGVGIEPDVRIDVSDTDAAAFRDTILDAAITNLRSRASQ